MGFVAYEKFKAPTPLFPFEFFANRTVMATALIGLFDFISFYLQVRLPLDCPLYLTDLS